MISLALLLASTQASTSPIGATPAPAPPPLDSIYRRQGFSEAAIPILNSDVGGFHARIEAAREAIAGIEDRIAAAIRADEPDLAAIAALAKEKDKLALRHRELITGRMLAVAAALAPDDRKVYLRLHNPPGRRYRPRPVAPPPPPSPPSPPRF